eukprot:11175186-Lingulodinium_polyedra.AAC.1
MSRLDHKRARGTHATAEAGASRKPRPKPADCGAPLAKHSGRLQIMYARFMFIARVRVPTR